MQVAIEEMQILMETAFVVVVFPLTLYLNVFKVRLSGCSLWWGEES